jgi:undecaprenyl-diphosphatase
MTLLFVMPHTGTMFAVIVYFWKEWRRTFFRDLETLKRFAVLVVVATVLTGVIGEVLVKAIEHTLFRHHQKAEIEQLFSHLELSAPALFLVGVLILIAGLKNHLGKAAEPDLGLREASLIGAVQGLAIPFRGFSRSGATISTGMLAGVERRRAEAFSFALAVVLTPPVVFREAHRLTTQAAGTGINFAHSAGMSLVGMLCAFLAGLLALKWLSRWLETGRWYLFGIYCVIASGAVFALWRAGY